MSSSSSSSGSGPPESDVDYLGLPRHVDAWIVGGLFAYSSILISLYSMWKQYKCNKVTRLRQSALWVLGMVPVYSWAAWWGLYQKQNTEYWDLLRECYEAVAIYAFFRFLLGYLGGRKRMMVELVTKPGHHLFPCCCLPHWEMGEPFLNYCTYGTLQYVPIKLLMAGLTFGLSVAAPTDNGGIYYEDGNFSVTNAYPYIALVTNASQIWAMYSLVMFYHALAQDLQLIRPIAKFLCIKAVVFFTFWQSVLVSAMVYFNYLKATATYTTENVSSGFEDFLICVEMFIAALAHIYAFPASEFAEGSLMYAEAQANLTKGAEMAKEKAQSGGAEYLSSVSSAGSGVVNESGAPLPTPLLSKQNTSSSSVNAPDWRIDPDSPDHELTMDWKGEFTQTGTSSSSSATAAAGAGAGANRTTTPSSRSTSQRPRPDLSQPALVHHSNVPVELSGVAVMPATSSTKTATGITTSVSPPSPGLAPQHHTYSPPTDPAQPILHVRVTDASGAVPGMNK